MAQPQNAEWDREPKNIHGNCKKMNEKPSAKIQLLLIDKEQEERSTGIKTNEHTGETNWYRETSTGRAPLSGRASAYPGGVRAAYPAPWVIYTIFEEH